MARFSNALFEKTEKDPRLKAGSYDADEDGHWILCAEGFCIEPGAKLLHEWNVKDMLAAIAAIEEDK